MSRDVLESFLPPETMKKIALVILSNPLREKNVNIKEYARAFLCKSGYENVEEIMRELENMGVFQGPQAMIRVCVEIFCTAYSGSVVKTKILDFYNELIWWIGNRV